jgi:F-type H+-transporting ATPase subunit gamma
MSESLEGLRRKIRTADELQSVVKTMKAVAAVAIGPAERAVAALLAYERTVELGLLASGIARGPSARQASEPACDVVVFGSDQGMVGPFNDQLATFVHEQLALLPGKKRVWPVGERLQDQLVGLGVVTEPPLAAAGGVGTMTPLIGQLLIDVEAGTGDRLYVAHNYPHGQASYEPSIRQLLPFDDAWLNALGHRPWPTSQRPESLVPPAMMASYLLREYAFVGLFRACAESLASEHGTRLASMLRAERNIQDVRDGLWRTYHHKRQAGISDELFDIIAGFEALS